MSPQSKCRTVPAPWKNSLALPFISATTALFSMSTALSGKNVTYRDHTGIFWHWLFFSTMYNALKIHPGCCVYQQSLLSYNWVVLYYMGHPGGSGVQNLPANAEMWVWSLGQEDPLEKEQGNGNPLQYSCLENPMARGSWRATVHGVAKNQTRLNDWAQTQIYRAAFLQKPFPSLFQLLETVC